MPTLRRSKSLNDKISRQKNRAGDVIRDPRSPEAGGRTRQCVDNFQALVHLRKQTEDKARQLDLALSYAAGNIPRPSLNLPSGPAGGVEIPFYRTQYRNSGPPCSEGRGPGLYRRQRSADNRASKERRESSSDVIGGQTRTRNGSQTHLQQENQLPQQQQHPPPPPLSQRVSCVRPQQKQQQQQQRVQRPMSMYETRPACGLPSREEFAKKEQVIQNLSESQRILGIQNEALLSKVEELEFQTAQLKKILSTHNISWSTLPVTSTAAPLPRRSSGVSSCPVTPLTAGRPPIGGTVHMKAEHSVSGYSSLAESACNGGVERGLGAGVSMLEEGGSEDAEAADPDRGWEEGECAGVRKLSRAESVATVESRMSTLARSVSSSDTFSVSTLPQDTDLESLHEVLDRALQREQSREASFCARIDELEKKVAEVTSQKAVVLRKFGEVLDHNHALRKCVEKARRELRKLTQKQCDPKVVVSPAELRAVLTHLQCSDDDVWSRLDLLPTSALTHEPRTSEALDLSGILDQLADFVGWDYAELARRLGVDLQKGEETSGSPGMMPDRKRALLETWLAVKAGDSRVNLSEQLGLMLDSLDTDIRLFDRNPVHGPERQALRNTLSYVIDHVTEAKVVQNFLDELTVLDVLTTEDVAFVRQVLQSPERELARVWHVAQYCGTGIVASLAHALERSGLIHVAIKLTDELELQNSRLHSLNRPATLQTSLAKESQTTETGADLYMRRSRPSTRSFRSKGKGETFPPAEADTRDSVWSRQLPAARVRGVVRGPLVVREGDRVSMV